MKMKNALPITNYESPITNPDSSLTNPSPWSSIEQSYGLTAVPANWRTFMHGQFALFKSAFLQKEPGFSKGYPCHICACTHEVFVQDDRPSPNPIGRGTEGEGRLSTINSPPSTIESLCRCDPPNCPHDHAPLTRADVELWSLHWPNLARGLCRALNLNYQFTDLKIYNTHQIGSWSADAIPVILTIQFQRGFFHSVITELISRLREKFILLAPTAKHFNAHCQELLANANAAFFPLDGNVILNHNGNLQPLKTPGELFARFTPAPKELDRSVAERAFALLQQLDTSGPQTPPSLVTVFRLYCIDELSAEEIARKCHCSKAAIVRRLLKIRTVTNSDPRDLRRISYHLATTQIVRKGKDDFHDVTNRSTPDDSEEPEEFYDVPYNHYY